MPVDTSGIQTIVNAFLQGQQLAQQAQARTLQGLQLERSIESDKEDRALRQQQLTEAIKQNALQHKMQVANLEATKAKNEHDLTLKVLEGYTKKELNLPATEFHNEQTESRVPEMLLAPELMGQLPQKPMPTMEEQLLNPVPDVTQNRDVSITEDHPAINDVVNMLGLKIPGNMFVPPEKNPNLIMKQLKEDNDRLKDLAQIDYQRGSLKQQDELKRLQLKISDENADEARRSREMIAAMNRDSRMEIAEMRKDEKDARKANASQSAVDGITKAFSNNEIVKKHAQIVTDANLLKKAAEKPESLTPIEQTRLLSLIPRYDDLRSSVREPEVQRAIQSLTTWYQEIGLKIERGIGGTRRIPVDKIREAGIIYGGILGPLADQYNNVRNPYVELLKGHNVPDEKIKILLPDLRDDDFEKKSGANVPVIDWSKVKGIAK